MADRSPAVSGLSAGGDRVACVEQDAVIGACLPGMEEGEVVQPCEGENVILLGRRFSGGRGEGPARDRVMSLLLSVVVFRILRSAGVDWGLGGGARVTDTVLVFVLKEQHMSDCSPSSMLGHAPAWLV